MGVRAGPQRKLCTKELMLLNCGVREDSWQSLGLPRICRWHHHYGRKWRTKKPLDESQRGEWISWIKAQHSENEDRGIQSHHFMAKRWGNSGNSGWVILGGSKITADGDCSHEIKRRLLLGRKVMTNLDSILKSRDIANKGPSIQGYGFSSGQVWMWELDYKERWALKNWCFWTVVLEKTLESPLACKEIQPVHPKGDQSWVFIGRSDAKAETPILWPPDAKNWAIWEDPDAGKDWRQE